MVRAKKVARWVALGAVICAVVALNLVGRSSLAYAGSGTSYVAYVGVAAADGDSSVATPEVLAISSNNFNQVAGTIMAQSGGTTAVAVSPSDNAVFALSQSGEARAIEKASIAGPTFIPAAGTTSAPLDASLGNTTAGGLAVSPNGAFVVSADGAGLHIVGTATGSVPGVIPYPDTGASVIVNSVSLSTDGTEAFVGGSLNFDGPSPAVLFGFNLATHVVTYFRDGPRSDTAITGLATSPDGATLWATESNESTTAGELLRIPLPFAPNSDHTFSTGAAFEGTPTSITISPDGNTGYLGTTGAARSLYQFGAHDAAPVPAAITLPTNIGGGNFDGIYDLAVTPDGHGLLATAHSSGVPGLTVGVVSNYLLTTSLPVPAVASPFSEHLLPVQAVDGLAITPDQAPSAVLPQNLSAVAGTAVHISAGASTVRFGFIASYKWVFPPGTCTPTTGVTLTCDFTTAGAFNVEVIETDSAGTSLQGTLSPGHNGVNFTGQTASRVASGNQAETTTTIKVSTTTTLPTSPATAPTVPPTVTTPLQTTAPTLPPTIPTAAPTLPTTPTVPTTTVAPTTVPARHPRLTVNPGIGPPGFVTEVTGSQFPPDSNVTITWSVGVGSATVRTTAAGTLSVPLLVMADDPEGNRMARAAAFPGATAPFLVSEPSIQPGGSESVLFRR